MEETRSMVLVEGMNDFIAKPIELKIIAAKLRQWLPKDKIYHVTAEERKAAEEKAKDTEADSAIGQLQETGLFDVKTAVSMLGTEELYWNVLQDYYNVIDKKSALIRVFFDTMDWKNYTIEVHALKSASRQIGANALADLAQKMEKAGNEQDYGFIKENQERLLHMYEGCKIALAPLMKKEESDEGGQKGPAPKDKLFAMFGELQTALSDLDMDGMESAVHKLTEYTYPADQQSLLVQLKEAVANLDVDTCQDVLAQWEACY
jgi:HPt (histidine-containing phosphotransfer) domain-containing protein